MKAPRSSDVPQLLGSSPAMQRVRATLERVTRYRSTVLLLGESGTGKDLVARTLHATGPGRGSRYEPVNCATLGPERLESELFGHERGAFTGAHARKIGLCEVASGGTLFLDEIAEMDLATQAQLLRVLDQRRFRRMGGTDIVHVDLCVIAATNRDLPTLVAAGRFREDLYYRLRVVTVMVPPLRNRKDDIPELVADLVSAFNRRHGTDLTGVSPRLLELFFAHDWPGNVRELRNAVESIAIFAQGRELGVRDAKASGFLVPRPRKGATSTARPTLEQAERALIEQRVAELGSREEAARSLGIGVRTLYSKLRRYGA